MERFYLDEKFQLLLKKLILVERIKEPGLGGSDNQSWFAGYVRN